MHSDSAFQNLILQKKSVGKFIFFSVIHNPKNVQFFGDNSDISHETKGWIYGNQEVNTFAKIRTPGADSEKLLKLTS